MKRHNPPSPPRRSTRAKRAPPTGPISIAIHAPPRPRPPPRLIITHLPPPPTTTTTTTTTTATTTAPQQTFYLPATSKSDLYTFFRADYARTGFRPTPAQLAAWFAYTHGGQQLPHPVVAAVVGGGGVVGRGARVGVNMAVHIRDWALARKEVVGCVPAARECMEWMQRVGMVMRGDVDVEGVLRGVVDEEEEGGEGGGEGDGGQRWVVLDGVGVDAAAGRRRRGRVWGERGEGVVLLREVEWRSCLSLPAAKCGSHEAAMHVQGLVNPAGCTGGWRDSERGESWDESVYGSGDTEGGSSDGSEETEPEDEKIRSSRRNTRFPTSTKQTVSSSGESTTHSHPARTSSTPVRRMRSSVKIERASSRHRYLTRGKARYKTEPTITPSTSSTIPRCCTITRAARPKQEHKRTTRAARSGGMALAPALTKQYTLRSRRSQTFVTKSDDESGHDCSDGDADDEDEDEDGSGSSGGDEAGESEDSMEDTIVIALPAVFALRGGGGGGGAGAVGRASATGRGEAGCGASGEEDEDDSEEEHSGEQEERASYSPSTATHEDRIPDEKDAAMNDLSSPLPEGPLKQEQEGRSQDTMAPVATALQPSAHSTESGSDESGPDGEMHGTAASGTARSSTHSGNDTEDDIGSTHSLQPSSQVQSLLVDPRYASPPLPDEDAEADADAERDAQAAATRGGRCDGIVPDSEADASDAGTAIDTGGDLEDEHLGARRHMAAQIFKHIAPLAPGHQAPNTSRHSKSSDSNTLPVLANRAADSTLQGGSAQSITNTPRPPTSAAAETAYQDEDEWSNMGETTVSEGRCSPAEDVPAGSLEGYAAAGGGADAEETETQIDWDLQGDTTVSEGGWSATVPQERVLHNAGLSGAWVLYTSPDDTPTEDERDGENMDEEEEEKEEDGSEDESVSAEIVEPFAPRRAMPARVGTQMPLSTGGDAQEDSVEAVRAAEVRANAFVEIGVQRSHRGSTGSCITGRDVSSNDEGEVSAADGPRLLQRGDDRLADNADRRSVPVDTAPDDNDDEIFTRWRKRKRALRHASNRSSSSGGSGGSGRLLRERGALRGADTADATALESPAWQHFTEESQEQEKLGEEEEARQWQWQWQWPSTETQPLQDPSWNNQIEGQRDPSVERQTYMDGSRMGTVDGEGEGEGEELRESGPGALDARLWEWYGGVTGGVTMRELEVRVERIVGGRHLPQGWLQGWVVRRGVSVREERGSSPEYPISLEDDEE